MMIIYFFDVDKPPHVETLLVLDGLIQKRRDTNLTVWGITRSDKSDVITFLKKTSIGFPILFDNSDVSARYDAILLRPTACIIGPNLKIIDHMTGTSSRTQKLLVKLAERKLQQNKPQIAEFIVQEALQKDPENTEAIAVVGNSEADMNNLKQAEKDAKKLIEKKGPSEMAGKEILAKVYIRQGKTDKALKIINEVMKKAPKRAWPHILKGDILYSQGKKKEADAEYQTAIKATEDDPYYIAKGHHRKARIDLENGEPEKARQHADTAEKLSPHDLEYTTLKGQTYENEGRLDEAWKTYREVQKIDKDDFYVKLLEERANDKKDAKESKIQWDMVKDLAERYKQDKEKPKPKSEDTWTSQPTMLTFLDFQESGHSMAVREGFSTVMIYKLIKDLKASGRVRVVNRELLTKVLQELNLGSSDLANPNTRRKLGKIFAAKIIVTGNLAHFNTFTQFELELMDVETTENEPIDIEIGYGESLKDKLDQLNQQILNSVKEKYPLQAYIMKVDGAYVDIAIGPDEGVVLGTKFNVIGEPKKWTFKDKTYYEDPMPVANIEVIKIKGNYCRGLIKNQKRPVKIEDKVKETTKFVDM